MTPVGHCLVSRNGVYQESTVHQHAETGVLFAKITQRANRYVRLHTDSYTSVPAYKWSCLSIADHKVVSDPYGRLTLGDPK